MRKSLLLPAILSLALITNASAQKAKAKMTVGVKSEPITLFVDASETPRKILHTRETIPAIPGAISSRCPTAVPAGSMRRWASGTIR